MHALGCLTTWIVMLAVVVSGQKRPSLSQPESGMRSECLGNIMRLSLDKALAVGNNLEIDAISGTDLIPLTPSLAMQCGYSMESDPWGNTRIYSSLFGCYVDNKDDETVSLGLNVKLLGNHLADEVIYTVTKTCSYPSLATRSILCDRNYMEVSTQLFKTKIEGKTILNRNNDLKDDSWRDSIKYYALHSLNDVWKMMFFTPEPKVMVVKEAQKAGYGVLSTSNRLVIRSPYNTAETYSEDVAGVLMEVLSVSAYYVPIYGLHIVDSAAACPTGGLMFTDEVITWHVPSRIDPIVKGAVTILEMHMGINGQRLDETKMAARHYNLSSTESHIIIELPVGSPDGYYKSLAPDDQYHITFTIEPMLELLWQEEQSQTETQYKVLFPITTPLMPRPPQFTGDAVAEQRLFDLVLGPFLYDVELVNFTSSGGVLSVAECNSRGFNVQEHRFQNGSKSFSLKVPFDDEIVLKRNPEPSVTVYYLSLTFGLRILPEDTLFSHPAEVEVSLQDEGSPTITGACDLRYFHLTVEYGSQGHNFRTMISKRELTFELAEKYGLLRNRTHFSLVVPSTSTDSIFEVVMSTSISARIDLELLTADNRKINDFSLSCNFPLTTTECFSNGTMTALAVKVASVPDMIPSLLRLRDDSCKPEFSNDRFAFFSFRADSCGTTRTFFGNTMVYENDITCDLGRCTNSPTAANYRQTVTCYYLLNVTGTLAFLTQPRIKETATQIGIGHLVVEMRLAQDVSYELFYQAEDYPVVKYLREPLYFEVELMQSIDPMIELVLENCWATLHEDRASLPSWDLITESCENLDDRYSTVFHPVVADARINIPAHVKRFSVKMFTFTKDDEVLKDKIYVHCDAVICDLNVPSNGICSSQCERSTGTTSTMSLDMEGKRGHRGVDYPLQKEQLSSGPILLADPK